MICCNSNRGYQRLNHGTGGRVRFQSFSPLGWTVLLRETTLADEWEELHTKETMKVIRSDTAWPNSDRYR